MGDIAKEMQQKADCFRVQYGEYFRGRISEEKLMEQTTQPFWQSVRLSRRRLEEKGLSLDVILRKNVKKPSDPNGQVKPQVDGWHHTGISTDSVLTERRFKKDGKIIYSHRGEEISNVSLLKSKVDGEEAACPNCGHIGRISSFIDGCDYCDSKFLVSDFETKISGFSLEENQHRAVKKIFKKSFKTMIFMSLAVFFLIVISLIVMLFLAMSGNVGKEAITATLVMVYGVSCIPIYGRVLISSFVLYFVGKIILRLMYREVIVGEEIVKREIPEFSAVDFYQNLEYKLRNIHFTDSAKEVQPFAGIDLTEIVSKYKNVVDCSLTRVRFLDAKKEQSQNRYLVSVEARMKLILIQNEKIKVRHERLKLELSGTYEMLRHNCNAIREYKCDGCGAGVDILNGGICAHCGNSMDYGKYGWVIEQYESGRKFRNIKKCVQFAVSGMFLFIVLVNAVHFFKHSGEDSLSWREMFHMIIYSEEIMNSYFDAVPLPTDAGISAALVSEETSYLVNRRWVYDSEDAEAAFHQYVDYLQKDKKSTDAAVDAEKLQATLHVPIPRTEEIMQSYHFEEGGIEIDMDIDTMNANVIISVTVEHGQLIVAAELTDV